VAGIRVGEPASIRGSSSTTWCHDGKEITCATFSLLHLPADLSHALSLLRPALLDLHHLEKANRSELIDAD